MNWIIRNRIARNIVAVLYGLAGLFVACGTLVRLWQEGTFGNNSPVLFITHTGPVIGLLTISAGLFLTVGQTLVLFNKKSGIWLSRMSFLLAIVTLAAEYLIYETGYIWGYEKDLLLFSIILTIFYLPVILNQRGIDKSRALNSTSVV